MKVTSKGQVTIPQHIREQLGILPHSEVEFVEEKGRVYLRKKGTTKDDPSGLASLRGIAKVGLSTDEILALTRA